MMYVREGCETGPVSKGNKGCGTAIPQLSQSLLIMCVIGLILSHSLLSALLSCLQSQRLKGSPGTPSEITN